MIGKLQGSFDSTTPEGAVLIDVQGVGYSVRVPLATLQELLSLGRNKTGETKNPPAGGKKISLLIHTAMREDAIDLYGFKTSEELSLFKQLLSVGGIGPKTALGILNVADVKTLRRSIARGEAGALTKVFGIGKRTAERVVVELKDKLASEAGVSLGGDDGEVIEALMALGYSAAESRKALQAVAPETAGVHNRLAQALRQLGQKQ